MNALVPTTSSTSSTADRLFALAKEQAESYKGYSPLVKLGVGGIVLALLFVATSLVLPFFTGLVTGLIGLAFKVAVLAAITGGLGVAYLAASRFGPLVIEWFDLKAIEAKAALLRAQPYETGLLLIQKATEGLQKAQKSAASLQGKIINHRKRIEELGSRREAFLASAKEARDEAAQLSGDAKEEKTILSTSYATRARQTKDAEEKLKPALATAEDLHRKLTRGIKVGRIKLEEGKYQLQLEWDTLKMNRETEAGVNEIYALLSGPEKERLNEVLNVMVELNSDIEGRVQSMLDIVEPILDEQDFENGMKVKQAMNDLDRWINGLPPKDQQQITSGDAIDTHIEIDGGQEVFAPVPVPAKKSGYNL